MFHFLVADVAYPQVPSGSDSLLVGMLIVIAALLLVSICIQLITLSSHRSGRAKPVPAAPAAVAAPAQPTRPVETDGQLIAVITAAIAATMASDRSPAAAGTSAPGLPAGFRVRRIRRI